jgi:hypothetical protein
MTTDKPVAAAAMAAGNTITRDRTKPNDNGGTDSWWKCLEEAKAFKARHGHLRFAFDGDLGAWAADTRKKWRKGGLTARQVNALQEIGFEQEATSGRFRAGKGKLVQDFLTLNEKIANGEGDEYDIKGRNRMLGKLRSRYAGGSLSRDAARQVGLIL